ncbi:MAG: Sialate O-acetylesterase, partial [Phycisphaerales bacterium]|nr:Sialate O-acetylesterase [Phycisphaerales bacterium]
DSATKSTVEEVLIGDVWLCSGQSNMQMSLGEADNGRATAAKAGEHPKLRLFKVGSAWTPEPQDNLKGEWKSATPESAAKFSAVGYFFGSNLLKSPELKDVALGLIESDLGGTLAEAWTPREGLDPNSKAGDSMFGIKPTTLYNGMIHPMGELGIKGVIWYQGEGNAGEPQTYTAKLSAMINSWRKQFKNPELPFLIVQLPDYAPDWGGYYWQWLRDAQQQTAAKLPNVAVINSVNTNDGLDLHPKPKQAIGERGAILARQMVYGEKIVGKGPMFKSADATGDSIKVSFDTGSSGLGAADPDDVHGFTVAGEDGKFRKATAKIEGDDTVVVRSDLVASPKYVRYAWAGVPMSTLTNKDGMPAYAFRNDTLPADMLGLKIEAAGRTFGNKLCQITVADGYITSMTVRGRQLLANETGGNRGVNTNGAFGPSGIGQLNELGPDLIQLGGREFNVQVGVEDGSCTWTLHNSGKDPRTLRMNLSPRVKVSNANGGKVTLNRQGLTVKVSGVANVTRGDDVALEFKAAGNSDTKVEFDFGNEK